MTIEARKNSIYRNENYNTAGWSLLERVYEVMMEKGLEPDWIEGMGSDTEHEGGLMIWLEIVSRRNGTSEDVSVDIKVTKRLMRKLGFARVPKNASDKVIARRVEKALEIMRENQ